MKISEYIKDIFFSYKQMVIINGGMLIESCTINNCLFSMQCFSFHSCFYFYFLKQISIFCEQHVHLLFV